MSGLDLGMMDRPSRRAWDHVAYCGQRAAKKAAPLPDIHAAEGQRDLPLNLLSFFSRAIDPNLSFDERSASAVGASGAVTMWAFRHFGVPDETLALWTTQFTHRAIAFTEADAKAAPVAGLEVLLNLAKSPGFGDLCSAAAYFWAFGQYLRESPTPEGTER
jgi:hypothetical protein